VVNPKDVEGEEEGEMEMDMDMEEEMEGEDETEAEGETETEVSVAASQQLGFPYYGPDIRADTMRILVCGACFNYHALPEGFDEETVSFPNGERPVWVRCKQVINKEGSKLLDGPGKPGYILDSSYLPLGSRMRRSIPRESEWFLGFVVFWIWKSWWDFVVY
jgi:hypothetical protein